MANQWLRLWHDMPNDPKWRTIARIAKQSVPAVICVYLHVLIDASANAGERGRTQSLNAEDVASALDLETENVEAILSAMQGRVLDGGMVAGWEKRQPAREDGSAERAKAWREAKKNAERTQANAKKRPDKDKDKEVNNPPVSPLQAGGNPPDGQVRKGREKRESTTFEQWLAAVRAAGEKPISEYEPLTRYMKTVGLPLELVGLAWDRFKSRYTETEKGRRKRYADWRATFLNAIKDNWFKLWYLDASDSWQLTTAGKQADLEAASGGGAA